MFDNRYRVVRKLGWGHFSTVWLCREILYEIVYIGELYLEIYFLFWWCVCVWTRLNFPNYWIFNFRKDNYVALKVIKSAQHYTETAADEIRLLKKIARNESQHPWCERIVRLLNHFTIRGVNGVHTCLVFETLGCSLYKLIVKNNFQGLPIKMVKSITRQVTLNECFSVCFYPFGNLLKPIGINYYHHLLQGFTRFILSTRKVRHHPYGY